MATTMTGSVLADEFWPAEGAQLWLKRAVLVGLGILALALAAKMKIPLWPSPVPVTMGTFAVLTIGVAYGPRLGLVTIFGYMLIGALGFDVFANSSAEIFGVSYMLGSTGGYLVGFVLATLALGILAQKGWDRTIWKMAGAMMIGNVLIYIPGILWLAVLYGFDKPILAWGLTPFLIGDAMKLVLAALIVPGVWAVIGRSRS